jgi:hypothetical protein
MKQTSGWHKRSAHEVYLRQGFASCIILLSEDGTIANGPGHAEVRWSWDQETLVLRDAESQITGRLDKQDGSYACLARTAQLALRLPLWWPAG